MRRRTTEGAGPPSRPSMTDRASVLERGITMKRELLSILLGAAFLAPAGADAQRPRARAADGGPRVERLEPITRGGRVAPRTRVARVRHAPAPSRIVYTSHAGYRAPLAYRPYRDSRVRIRLEWGHAPLRLHERPYLDRSMSPGELRRLLGPHTVNRIRRAGRRSGLRGPVRGHWIDTWRHGLVLVVTMERTDLAEFIDYDRDGLIDDAFFFRHHAAWNRVSWP